MTRQMPRMIAEQIVREWQSHWALELSPAIDGSLAWRIATAIAADRAALCRSILQALPGGQSCDPQAIADMVRTVADQPAAEREGVAR